MYPGDEFSYNKALGHRTVANGYKISFNNAAEFYDEQPVDIKIAMRQRIRWAKGHLQAVAETGPKLLSHIFVTHGMANKNADANTPEWKKLINNIRLRFMSFDMLTVVFPRAFGSFVKRVLILLLRIITILGAGTFYGVNYAPEFMRKIFAFFDFAPSETKLSAVFWICIFTLGWTISSYVNGIITAAYIFIIEHKRIKKIKLYKKIWFCITFPIFDLINKLSTLIAVFSKVEWKPIPHNAAISISDLNAEK